MIYAPGATSQSIDVQIVDDTGLPVTGLLAATFPATSWSRGGNTAAPSVTLSDLALITSAYSAGGVKERSGGYYRFDVPDAALASTGQITLIGEESDKHLLGPRLDVEKVAATIAAGDIATDAITAASVKADAVTKIQAGLSTYAGGAVDSVTGNVGGNVTGSVGSVAGLTASDVGAIKTQTDKLTFTVSNQIDANVLDWKSATAPAMTGDAFARLGAPAGASVSADVAAVKTDTGNLVTRITSALFSGITSLAQWLGMLAGKQTGNSTARTEIRATGAGAGTFDETTDSQEATRDRGDLAWLTPVGFSTFDPASQSVTIGTASGNALVAAVAAQVASDHGSGSYIRNTEPPTASDVAAAVGATAIKGKTLVQSIAYIGAMVAGKASGAGTGTEVFSGFDGVSLVTVTVDSDGNRSAVSYAS